jgi:NAD-dependent SIR2 family protein deacetylase
MPPLTLPAPLIRDSLERGAVIPFLGAGASLAATPAEGLPSTGALAHALALKTSFPKDQPPDLATVAQWYEVVAGRRPLYRELREVFARRRFPPTALHRYLAAVQAPLLIVTTNYDDLIEQAFEDAGKPYDLVVHTTDRAMGDRLLWWPHGAAEPKLVRASKLDIDLATTPVIYQMHGGIDRELPSRDQYVITEDDYIDFLTRMTTRTAFPAIFAEPFEDRHFLFLGYGLQDWNLRVVLNRVQRHLHHGFALTSWAIDAFPSPLEQRFWQDRGVEVFEMTIGQFLARIDAD